MPSSRAEDGSTTAAAPGNGSGAPPSPHLGGIAAQAVPRPRLRNAGAREPASADVPGRIAVRARRPRAGARGESRGLTNLVPHVADDYGASRATRGSERRTVTPPSGLVLSAHESSARWASAGTAPPACVDSEDTEPVATGVVAEDVGAAPAVDGAYRGLSRHCVRGPPGRPAAVGSVPGIGFSSASSSRRSVCEPIGARPQGQSST